MQPYHFSTLALCFAVLPPVTVAAQVADSLTASRSTQPTTGPPWAGPSWVSAGVGLGGYEEYGAVVASAGDVNGDGYDDIVIGAPGYPGNFYPRGAVYIHHGSPCGPSPYPDWSEFGGPLSDLGGSVASGFDVNGDGYDDLVVAEERKIRFLRETTVRLHLGSPQGLRHQVAWSFLGSDEAARLLVASAGDVDGNGFDDLLVANPRYDIDAETRDVGRVDLFLGSASGLAVAPAWTRFGSAGEQLGSSLSACDVNGDGYSDLLLAAWRFAGAVGQGAIRVHHGSPTGPSAAVDLQLEGDLPGLSYATQVACAGDVDADGFDDVLITSQQPLPPCEGYVFLHRGSSGGLEPVPSWTEQNVDCSLSIATAGDVDGDGHADIVVGGIRLFTYPTFVFGRASLYRGAPTGLETTPFWEEVPVQTNPQGVLESNRFGAVVASAGDVDGSGLDAIIVANQAFLLPRPDEVWVYRSGIPCLTPYAPRRR